MKVAIQNFLNQYRLLIALFLASKLIHLFLTFAIPWLSGHDTSWKNWDANIYLEIASHGYSFQGEPSNPSLSTPNSIAFFPLYPLCIRLLSWLTPLPPLWTGLFLSSLFTLLAALALHKLTEHWASKKVADLSVFFMLFAPGSIFLSGVYTESLFILWITLCLRAIYFRKLTAAGIYLGLASVTRLPALALLPAFWLELLVSHSSVWILMLSSFLSVFPLTLFILYQSERFGEPLAFIEAQKLGWQRALDWPWTGIRALWEYGGEYPAFRVDLVLLLLFAMILISQARKLPFKFSLYAWGIFALAVCTSWPLSVTRILLTAVPIYMATAILLSKHRLVCIIIMAISFVWSVAGSYFYLIRGMFM